VSEIKMLSGIYVREREREKLVWGVEDIEKTTRSLEVSTLHILIGILLKMGDTDGNSNTVAE
jgi:hypothetical protein